MNTRSLLKPKILLAFAVFFPTALAWPVPAHCMPAPRALSKADIIELLKGGVEQPRIAGLARDHGISFQLTSDVEDELRRAGAKDDLLATLREIAPKAPGITIEATPGDAEVYVDDERVGKTSSEGRLRLTKLSPGQHTVRISHDGYRDFERTIDLKGGGSVSISTELQKAGADVPAGGQTDAMSNNVHALLNKVVAAMGGAARLRTVRGFRVLANATLYLPQGAAPGTMDTVFDFSGRIWQRFTTTSTAITMVVTPMSGFMSSPAGSADLPILQRNELLKNIWRNAFYVVQHLDDPTFSFMPGGTAMIGGVNTEILDMAGGGAECRWYIDPNSGFIVRASWMEMGTNPAEIVEDLSNWRLVSGFRVPFQQTSTRNGQIQSTGTITSVEVNPAIDAKLFNRY